MEKDEEEQEINAILRKGRSRSKSVTSVPTSLLMTKLKSKSTVTVLLKENKPQEFISNDAEIHPIRVHRNILNSLTTEETDPEDGNKTFATKLFSGFDKDETGLDQIITLEEEEEVH